MLATLRPLRLFRRVRGDHPGPKSVPLQRHACVPTESLELFLCDVIESPDVSAAWTRENYVLRENDWFHATAEVSSMLA